jgi:hypothetical protein
MGRLKALEEDESLDGQSSSNITVTMNYTNLNLDKIVYNTNIPPSSYGEYSGKKMNYFY